MNTADTDIRSRLSWTWVFVMINLIFADILSFMNPGVLQQILAGRAEEIAITPEFLLLAAIVTEIPIAMIVLSQVLRRPLVRWVNLVASGLTIAYVIGMGTATPHYVFLAGLETVGCLYIARLAWGWRDAEGRVPARELAMG